MRTTRLPPEQTIAIGTYALPGLSSCCVPAHCGRREIRIRNADRRPGIPADGAPSRRSAPDFGFGSAGISWLPSELRSESVHAHLVVLVLCPWSDRAFDHLTHGVDGFAFPDADAESVIVGACMDWQRNVGRKPTFHRFGLGVLEAVGVVNSVDDCHKHGVTVRSPRGSRVPPIGEAFVRRATWFGLNEPAVGSRCPDNIGPVSYTHLTLPTKA